MIKLKDYYSDVLEENDKFTTIECNSCLKIFSALEMLLDFPDVEDVNEEEITEHCPFCLKMLNKTTVYTMKGGH